MDLMEVRRRLLMMPTQEAELYPIGTDIIGTYVGRSDNGLALFEENVTIDKNTGEYISGGLGGSPIFMLINPVYSYQKSRHGRLYILAFYDSQYQYISYIGHPVLDDWTIEGIPTNAKYCRIITHKVNSNWGIKITRTA